MRSSEFQLIIISAEKKIFSGNVTSLVAPGVSGQFGVYPDHAAMITALKKGVVVYKTNAGEQTLEVNGGVVEVNKNVVTICVE